MFQNFTGTGHPEHGPGRIAELRRQMASQNLDACLVPRADAHQGEYVAPCDARLEWLTGFTGSAGIAAITREAAALFVDGRYRVQARAEVPDEIATIDWPATKPQDWLVERLGQGAVLGFDPWLHTRREIDAIEAVLSPSGIGVLPMENPLDAIWSDRPAPPCGPVAPYPDELAGTHRDEKRARIAADLRDAGQAWAFVSLPDSLCWLLNIRGADLPHVPVAQGFALIEAATGEVRLFMNAEKLGGLRMEGVDCLPPRSLVAALANLSGPVRVDPDSAPWIVGHTLEEARIEIAWDRDPCILPKARKSDAEIDATRIAHLRDGAAMCTFLHWLDGRIAAVQEGETVTEIDVVRALEGFRTDTGELRDISFDTIAGTGPHGAITHYRVTEETNRPLATGDLLLVDSGGQYLDGTTDITRTIPVGPPGDDEIACFTRVLKGMIAVSRARWPKGLAGRDLDALARAPLWRHGQDYDHGTGHGVGVYLSVHEGPQRLSRASEVPLSPGMILSNEPGYYREGAFGIRIENLVVVEPAPEIDGADAWRDMLGFETLTWAPIDRRLIDVDALSRGERAWLDAYHAGVAQRMTGRVSPEVAEWLGRATAPL